MYKRILALFLVALTLIFSVPLTAFAEEETSKFEWYDLNKTTIKEDLKGFDFSKYKKDSSILNPSIIAVAEQGFSANMDYNECALYLYLYVPMADKIDFRSNFNKVQIKNGNTFVKYSLSYVCMEGDTVVKYKVSLPRSFFEKLNKTGRVYEISAIEFGEKSGAPTPKDYKIGGKYTFSGFDEHSSLRKVETFEVLRLNINYTTFRNTSSLGADYRNQLTSVYFSIPNYILKKYDYKLYGIDCEYEKYYTKPIIVTQNQSVFDKLSSLSYDSLNEYTRLKDPIITYHNNPDVSLSMFSGYLPRFVSTSSFIDVDTWEFKWSYNFNFSKMKKTSSSIVTGQIFVDKYEIQDGFFSSRYIPLYFLTNQSFDSDFWIKKEEVQGKVNSIFPTLSKEGRYLINGLDYYHEHLFENYFLDSYGNKIPVSLRNSKITTSITLDDEPYNMISYGENHTWWDKLRDFGLSSLVAGLKNDVTFEGIEPISVIKSSDYKDLTTEEFSKKYFVDKNEVSEVITNVVKAEAKKETTYIFRVDVAPYKSMGVYTWSDGVWEGNKTFMVQEPVYMGFDVLDLMFKDKNGEVVKVAVSSNPENLVGAIEPDLDGVNNGDASNNVNKFFAIVMFVISIIVSIIVFPHIRDLLASFIDGLATGIDGATKPKYTGNESKKRKRRKRK